MKTDKLLKKSIEHNMMLLQEINQYPIYTLEEDRIVNYTIASFDVLDKTILLINSETGTSKNITLDEIGEKYSFDKTFVEQQLNEINIHNDFVNQSDYLNKAYSQNIWVARRGKFYRLEDMSDIRLRNTLKIITKKRAGKPMVSTVE